MTLKLPLIAATVSLALSGIGFASAASYDKSTHAAATAATCESLTKQADSAISAHKDAKKADAARKLRADGDKECKAGNHEKGASDLRQAITDLGMTPVD
jgi:hypothetical protein